MKAKRRWLPLLGAAFLAAFIAIPGAATVQAAEGNVETTITGVKDAEVGDTVSVTVSFSSDVDLYGIESVLDEDSQEQLQITSVNMTADATGVMSDGTEHFVAASLQPIRRGTITYNFEVLKCSESPVEVGLSFLFGGYEDIMDPNGEEIAVYKDLSTQISIAHPEAQYQVDETAASCDTAGHRTVTCGLCGATVLKEDIAPLGHDSGSWTVTENATCTQTGTRELHCNRCGDLLDTEVIPMTEHTWVDVEVTKEATCTETGEKTVKCSVCGLEDTVEIPMIAHSWVVDDTTDEDGWKVVVEATEEKEGSKERVCSVCGEKETAVIPKLTVETQPETTAPAETETEPATSAEDNTETTAGTEAETGTAASTEPASSEGTAASTESSTENGAVKTGDNTAMALYVVLGIAAVGVVGGLIVLKRRKNI